MNASLAIKRCEEAKKLPLGHVDIKKTEEVVKKIYHQSHLLQKYWNKRLDKFRFPNFNAKDCIKFCNSLCRIIGANPVKRVICKSPEIQPGTAGHYCYGKREIHFCYYPTMSTLVHELAHHVVQQAGKTREEHGKDFCFVENWLFQLAYERLTGKKPKPYWVEESEKILEKVDPAS